MVTRYLLQTRRKIESRVINMSGLIIGTDIYDVREKETEIKELLINRVVYFYDEYVGKGFLWICYPNINQSNYRGKGMMVELLC